MAVHIGQLGTASKGFSINPYTLGQHDNGEAAAIIECLFPYARHALGDGDGGKAATTPESTTANRSHTFGNGNALKTATVS